MKSLNLVERIFEYINLANESASSLIETCSLLRRFKLGFSNILQQNIIFKWNFVTLNVVERIFQHNFFEESAFSQILTENLNINILNPFEAILIIIEPGWTHVLMEFSRREGIQPNFIWKFKPVACFADIRRRWTGMNALFKILNFVLVILIGNVYLKLKFGTAKAGWTHFRVKFRNPQVETGKSDSIFDSLALGGGRRKGEV